MHSVRAGTFIYITSHAHSINFLCCEDAFLDWLGSLASRWELPFCCLNVAVILPSQSKVRHFELLVGTHQDIATGKVSVHNPKLTQVLLNRKWMSYWTLFSWGSVDQIICEWEKQNPLWAIHVYHSKWPLNHCLCQLIRERWIVNQVVVNFLLFAWILVIT